MHERMCDWRAARYEGRLKSGRTRPLLIDAERRQGGVTARMRCIAKARGCPEVEDFTLCHEYLGCRLARLFGLAAPDAEFVWMSPEFLEANRDELLRDGGRIEPGVAVGVEQVPHLLTFPIPAELHESEVVEGARVFAFDLLVQNADRRAKNPNCGRAGGRIVPYDFESAFGFRFAILAPEAWRVSKLGFEKQHLFYAQLRRSVVDWDAVLEPFRAVSWSAVEEACGTLPEVCTAVGRDVFEHLQVVKRNWHQFETEVRTALETTI